MLCLLFYAFLRETLHQTKQPNYLLKFLIKLTIYKCALIQGEINVKLFSHKIYITLIWLFT